MAHFQGTPTAAKYAFFVPYLQTTLPWRALSGQAGLPVWSLQQQPEAVGRGTTGLSSALSSAHAPTRGKESQANTRY